MFFLPTFAILFNEREEVHNISEGSIAQLVQSVCLTSRGSGVRIPQRPLPTSTLAVRITLPTAKMRTANFIPPWKDAGVVDRGGLENRCALAGTQGSNPCLSANDKIETH